jgi:hypothetical protein
MSYLGRSALHCLLHRADTAGAADYVEEQWRFYGFCDTFEQARYIAVHGLSVGLGEPFKSYSVVLLPRIIAKGTHHSHLHELALFASLCSAYSLD